MSRPLLYAYFDDTAQILLKQFQRSSQEESPTDLGLNREHFCSEFLKKALPPKLSITKGEIWDSHGNKTGQLDVIVNRDDCPCLHIGSANIYLAEGVFAVIEVKSDLTTAKLQEASDSLRLVESLSIEGVAAIAVGPVLNRPLRIVFSYKGATWETLMKYINDKNLWDVFDIICILERGVAFRKDVLLGCSSGIPFCIVKGKAAALGFLYFHLVSFGTAFIGRSVQIVRYFEPINSWENSQ